MSWTFVFMFGIDERTYHSLESSSAMLSLKSIRGGMAYLSLVPFPVASAQSTSAVKTKLTNIPQNTELIA